MTNFPPPHRLPSRASAGAELAARFAARSLADPVVLALPRGGVDVARPVASALRAPLDVVLVAKVGAPGQEELAMAAVTEGGESLLNRDVISQLALSESALQDALARTHATLAPRRAAYCAGRPAPTLAGRDVLVVDDGLATGVTMALALLILRRARPRSLLAVAPVAGLAALARIRPLADSVETLLVPDPFHGVGRAYADFAEVSHDHVAATLAAAASAHAGMA